MQRIAYYFNNESFSYINWTWKTKKNHFSKNFTSGNTITLRKSVIFMCILLLELLKIQRHFSYGQNLVNTCILALIE